MNMEFEDMYNGFRPLMDKHPELKYPSTEAKILELDRKCNFRPATLYAPKSQKNTMLKKELEIATGLLEDFESILSNCNLRWGSVNNICSRITLEAFRSHRSNSAEATKLNHEYYVYARRFKSPVLPLFTKFYNCLATAQSTIQSELNIEAKGAEGEETVASWLEELPEYYTVMKSLILPDHHAAPGKPKTAETDFCVITESTVYACEVKNYGQPGHSVRVADDGSFKILDKAGDLIQEIEQSPIAQNERHCRVISQTLAIGGIAAIHIIPVVVIADPEVTVINHSDYHVVNIRDFSSFLKAMDGAETQLNRKADAERVLRNHALAERKFPMTAISGIQDDLKMTLAELERACQLEHNWMESLTATVDEICDQADRKYYAEHNRERLSWKQRFEEIRTALLALPRSQRINRVGVNALFISPWLISLVIVLVYIGLSIGGYDNFLEELAVTSVAVLLTYPVSCAIGLLLSARTKGDFYRKYRFSFRFVCTTVTAFGFLMLFVKMMRPLLAFGLLVVEGIVRIAPIALLIGVFYRITSKSTS